MTIKKTTLRLQPTTARHLKVCACKQDRSMSDIAQEALERYFIFLCPEWQKDYIILEDEENQE